MARSRAATEATGEFGVYVHIPFCSSRCDYCAFATWTDRDHLMADYAKACQADLARAYAGRRWFPATEDGGEGSASGSGAVSALAGEAEPLPRATSVFFGGGTPSLLPNEMLVSVLDSIDRHPGAEVTVEANPENVTAGLARAYARDGVNRVSLGVQSMVTGVLAGLGRQHDPGAVPGAVARLADAGIDNYSVDLIYGGAGESDADWRASLEAVLGLKPAPRHVSAYALTVEPGTPLAREPSRHPDDDVQAERYTVAGQMLEAAGLSWYEISNWARPGFECRHNQLYWSQGDYYGVGAAAHSHRGGTRWWNVRTPDRYIKLVGQDRAVVAGSEVLDWPARARERDQLALRTREGVPAAALRLDHNLVGLVTLRAGRASLTTRGRMLANEVSARLV
ncbi:MAG: radical SAM family heme chaperone HemW [Acidimicrobiales bacterium]